MKIKIRNVLEIILIVLELIILGLYYIPEFFNISINYDNFQILFYFILVIFIHSFIDYKDWSKNSVLFRCAFLFTLIADYFMTYLDSYYEISIGFFFFVQLSYFILINVIFYRKYLKSSIIFYFSILSILFVIASILKLINLLTILAVIYFSLSLTNIAYLIRIKNKDKYQCLFLLGLVLFLLCDTCIGLQNVNLTNVKITNLLAQLVWIFYGPSQIVLVTSLTNYFKGVTYEKNIKS